MSIYVPLFEIFGSATSLHCVFHVANGMCSVVDLYGKRVSLIISRKDWRGFLRRYVIARFVREVIFRFANFFSPYFCCFTVISIQLGPVKSKLTIFGSPLYSNLYSPIQHTNISRKRASFFVFFFCFCSVFVFFRRFFVSFFFVNVYFYLFLYTIDVINFQGKNNRKML